MIEQTFFRGRRLESQGTDEDMLTQRTASEALIALFKESSLHIESREGRSPVWMMFDLDGVLVEEDVYSHTIDEYMERRVAEVALFQQSIARARVLGFRVGISTGRQSHFAHAIGEKLFAPSRPDTIISQSGIVIETPHSKTYARSIRSEDVEMLTARKHDIASYFLALGWQQYPQDNSVALVYPPSLDPEEALNQVRSYISETGIADSVSLIATGSVIDILPKGTNKQAALTEVLEGAHMIYFGDSANDHLAMTDAVMVVTPQNAHPATKAHAAESTGRADAKTMMTLHMQHGHLAGTAEAVKLFVDATEFLRSQEL